MLIPASVAARIRDEIAHLTGLVRHDIVQARHHVAPAARQARIHRSHHAERRQIGRLQRQVVGNGEAMGTSDGCRRASPTRAEESGAESRRRGSSPMAGRPSR